MFHGLIEQKARNNLLGIWMYPFGMLQTAAIVSKGKSSKNQKTASGDEFIMDEDFGKSKLPQTTWILKGTVMQTEKALII